MRRIIVDYAKLTNEILTLLVDKFPDGYDESNIIRFRNAQNELIEAVEVRTEDTIYLVKVSRKLADRIENYDEDDEIDTEVVAIDGIKGIAIEDDEEEEDEEIDLLKDKGGDENEDSTDSENPKDEFDEDEDDE